MALNPVMQVTMGFLDVYNRFFHIQTRCVYIFDIIESGEDLSFRI